MLLVDGNQLIDKSCSSGMNIAVAVAATAMFGFLIMSCGDSFYGKPFPGQEEHFATMRFWSFVVGAMIELGALAGFAWLVNRITPLELARVLFRRSSDRSP